MDKRARITISIPGNNRHISPDVILSDLAKKLRSTSLSAGVYQIDILLDGSVMLNDVIFWQPRPSVIEPKQPKKAG